MPVLGAFHRYGEGCGEFELRQRIQSVECFDRSDTRKKLEKEKMVVGSRMVVVMVVVVVVTAAGRGASHGLFSTGFHVC